MSKRAIRISCEFGFEPLSVKIHLIYYLLLSLPVFIVGLLLKATYDLQHAKRDN